MEEFKPGQVISPNGSEPSQSLASPMPTPLVSAPAPQPAVAAPPVTPAPVAAPQISAPQPIAPVVSQPAAVEPSWQFRSESGTSMPVMTGFEQAEADDRAPLPDELSWTASEFIAHEKSAGWYGMLALAGVAGAAVIYLLTKDKISTGIVLFAAIILGIFAARKPQVQQYKLNDYGLSVGSKMYGFQDFKSFAIAEEGAIASIVFMPLRRFMPALTIYVAPDMEEQVVDFLSELLPFEKHRQDAVDGLLRRIRF